MSGGQSAGGNRVLVADIGGTNARFSLIEHSETGPIEHLKVADFPNATDAIAAFLARCAGGPPEAALLAVAGPVDNNQSIITNSRWVIDGSNLQREFGFRTVHLLNDFEAVAWSLPTLQPSDLFPIGMQRPMAGSPMLVVGPGTGFGAACFFPGVPFAAVTEAGHTTLPVGSEREERVIDQLRRHFEHVSVERALSGSGLANLYQALAVIEGVVAPERDPAAITRAGLEGTCDVSRAALDMFCSLLGNVAGNLALTFCARGGVYIAGGIVPRFAAHLARSEFRRQFERKGRFESYLMNIPTNIILHPDSSFLGLKAYFERNVAASGSSSVRTAP